MARTTKFSKEDMLEKSVGFDDITLSKVDRDNYSLIRTRKNR